MLIKRAFSGVVVVVGLAAVGSVHAQGALAEEIWSASFCQQAVSLAKQHGESPETLNQVDCQGMQSSYQPSYWQCVIAALKADVHLELDAARQKCLAGY
ncbi:MAG TPA: hypothetical protein P5102_18710 [Candidatus Competibacteraceae bacterium]|nr:hypothetical protein [Candidatus Competibacteraceae bacterium]HRZ08130.1 hypothetical protein [Candidatus Competibacteraceae bacterium]HSA45781.1 hypothetical protein [Candidatus Competibacteraceae bacterium]